MSTILVVEDERDIAGFIRRYLEKAGYETEVAGTAAEAREALAAGVIDLAVLDVMLPDGDGFELCREIREVGSLPVLLVTARSADSDKLRGFELGADDYITKPFNPRELVARVDALARRVGLKPGETVRVDAEQRTVWVRGRETAVTPKEFDLLLLFTRHPGRVFSRGELLDRVWGENYFGDPKVVDVNVRRLREKIERDPSNPQLIRTIWGVGYAFGTTPLGGEEDS